MNTCVVFTVRYCRVRPSVAVGGSTSQRVHKRSVTTLLLNEYKSKVTQGVLRYDERQYRILQHFTKLQQLLVTASDVKLLVSAPAEQPPPDTASTRKRLRGLYLYGSVGTGKTMLMDSFFNSTPVASKRRVHFHDFMLEVHSRIHKHKMSLLAQHGRDVHINLSSARDSIAAVALELATEAKLLCFDEFQVTDICDAMILSRLFNNLWNAGVVLVATSNRHPSELYQGGLNRQYFLPFIENLQVHCLVRDIGSSCDYRQQEPARCDAYYVPATGANREKLRRRFEGELGGASCGAVSVPVMMGRALTLSAGCLERRVCFASFHELCEAEKGAADYHALCSHFSTVYLHGVPVLSVLSHNEARRMITLVDALYNNHVRLVWTAEAPPAQLFRALSAMELRSEAPDATLGTDHSWTAPVTSCDREGPQPAAGPETGTGNGQSLHLRGEEQRRLDISEYIGTAVALSGTTTSQPAVAQGADSPGAAAAVVDAAQEELKVLEGELASIQELSFAFRRAASRLAEMATETYERKWLEKLARTPPQSRS
jgi:predicted ATPase